jgi:hypothetical protein
MNDNIENKSVVIFDNTETSTFLTKSEVNFLLLPYFRLDKDSDSNHRIEFTEMQQQGDKTVEVFWTVNPHPDFGLPRDFERRLHRAVEHYLSFMPRPISNPVPLPNIRELSRIMGVTCSGRFAEKVRHGFNAMMMTRIMSKRSYYHKSKKAWIEDEFTLYDKIVFKGEMISKNEKADRIYAYFATVYLDNLNAMYVRPIDYEYLKSLTPVSSRLYEILGVKFYGHKNFIQYRYSNLCRLLSVKQQKTLSRARQQFDCKHEELKQSGFISSYTWIPIPWIKNDWYIRFVPGERFFNEIKMAQASKLAEAQQLITPNPAAIAEMDITPSIEEFNPDESIAFSGFNTNEFDDPLWSLFSGIVKKYPEFHLRETDREWFKQRIEGTENWRILNLREEIRNWEDWLETEYRQKNKNKNNKFPQSNFKGSLVNWLSHSLRAVNQWETSNFNASDTKRTGRKGFDLPSDYPIDVM